MRAEAAQSVARELALEALAERAGIEVSDDEVKELIREQAEAAGEDPEAVVEEVWSHGQQESLREDLRLRSALDRLAADVKPISVELAEARDKLWTPDKESGEAEKKLWTPGSEGART
jgi:trigger factor